MQSIQSPRSCVRTGTAPKAAGIPVASPRWAPPVLLLSGHTSLLKNNSSLQFPSDSICSSRTRVLTASGRDLPSTTPWSSGPPSRGPSGNDSKPDHRHLHLAAPGDGPSLDLSRGLAALLALNAAIFSGAALLKMPLLANLALYNSGGSWLQYVSSVFAHANMAQLSRNLFLLWLWGSALRREVTGPGVWFTYVICGLGSNLAVSYALGAKAKVGTALLGVAASGGCAGVALAALILTARPSLRWLMGAALAAQFTLPALLAAPVPFMPAAAGGAAAAGQSALTRLLPPWLLSGVGDQLVGSGGGLLGSAATGVQGTGLGPFLAALKSPAMSWLWGAAAGALIVVVLARLPVPPE